MEKKIWDNPYYFKKKDNSHRKRIKRMFEDEIAKKQKSLKKCKKPSKPEWTLWTWVKLSNPQSVTFSTRTQPRSSTPEELNVGGWNELI